MIDRGSITLHTRSGTFLLFLFTSICSWSGTAPSHSAREGGVLFVQLPIRNFMVDTKCFFGVLLLFECLASFLVIPLGFYFLQRWSWLDDDDLHKIKRLVIISWRGGEKFCGDDEDLFVH